MKTHNFPEVVDFLEGPGVRKWQFRESGIKLINIRNLVQDKLDLTNTSNYLDEREVADKYNHFLLSEGDLVMASSGVTWGKIAEVQKDHLPLCLNTSIIKLMPKNHNILEKRYLWHFIKSNIFRRQIDRLITGSAQPNFGPSHLKKIDIPLPPLPTQKKIAAILDAADAYRQKTKALIGKYDQLAQALFLDMFGDPVMNPKGWEKKFFKNIFHNLKYGTSTPPVYSKTGIPFIRATNVKNGGVALNGMVYISMEEANKIQKCKLSEGDIIIVRSGANTGDCSRIPEEYDGAYGGFDIIIKISEPYSHFYNFLLNTAGGKAILKPLTRRAGQPHLNSKQISNLNLIFPPKNEQLKFKERLNTIEQQKKQAQASLQKAEDLFNSLLQRAFKGELVKE